MSPDGELSLLGDVRDMQIVDADGHNCGICDDIELEGEPGAPLRISALLVGPGAYRERLPAWVFRLIVRVAGQRMVRVPWSAVERISGRIHLNRKAESVGLGSVDAALRPLLRKAPAL